MFEFRQSLLERFEYTPMIAPVFSESAGPPLSPSQLEGPWMSKELGTDVGTVPCVESGPTAAITRPVSLLRGCILQSYSPSACLP